MGIVEMSGVCGLPKMNECVERFADDGGWERVFDSFWRRGEVALMFGAPGAGKSVLAVQIAEAVARGGDIPWFDLEAAPGRVLYVDLVMRDDHFSRRYRTRYQGRDLCYAFSGRLHRARPPKGVELTDWIRSQVTEHGLQYVIVDDADAVRRTGGGTLDTVRLMREMRELADETGVSVLVLAASRPASPRVGPAEQDLGPQAALCAFADSVFAIGRWWSRPEKWYLVQTRSRNAPIEWTAGNAVGATIRQDMGGMLRFVFEASPDEQSRERICLINRMRVEGKTFREIGKDLGMSKSHVQRLASRWSMKLERVPRSGREDAAGENGREGSEQEKGDHPVAQSGDTPPFEGGVHEEEGITSSSHHPALEDSGTPPPAGGELCAAATPVFEGGEREEQAVPPAPFSNDWSDAAKEWIKKLVRENPERTRSHIVRDYTKGEEWCRPPGSVPPFDEDDPFRGMEMDDHPYYSSPRFVVERWPDGTAAVWYTYRDDGQLKRSVRCGGGIDSANANPNFFGKAARITREELEEHRRKYRGLSRM